MHTTPKRLGGIVAAVMVAVLIAATVVLFQHHPGTSGNNAAATPTLLAPTATQAPTLHVSASQGWVFPSALAFGKAIAFAPNAPLTGYVCGNMLPSLSATDVPLRFSVTHDGGATWDELAVTPAQGVSCELSIDPINAGDLVLFSIAHDGGGSAYRSHDGGHTWVPMLAPVGDGVSVNLGAPGWAGTTLFVNVTPATASANYTVNLAHTLAVSVNGGALTWVDTSHLFPPTPNVTQLLQGNYAVGTTFYATIFATPTSCPPKPNSPCSATVSYVSTSDNGATWAPYTLPRQLHDLPSLLADGHTLIGQVYTANVGISIDDSISKDGGQTWTTLPAYPHPAHVGYGIAGGTSAQDDTIYTIYSVGSAPNGLIKLSPDATAWTTVATTIPGLTVVTSVDGLGHPNAVWSTTVKNAISQPGIAYHAP